MVHLVPDDVHVVVYGFDRSFEIPDDLRGIEVFDVHDVGTRVVAKIGLVQLVVEVTETLVFPYPSLMRVAGLRIGQLRNQLDVILVLCIHNCNAVVSIETHHNFIARIILVRTVVNNRMDVVGICAIVCPNQYRIQWVNQVQDVQTPVEGVRTDGVRIPRFLVDHDVVGVAKTTVVPIR